MPCATPIGDGVLRTIEFEVVRPQSTLEEDLPNPFLEPRMIRMIRREVHLLRDLLAIPHEPAVTQTRLFPSGLEIHPRHKKSIHCISGMALRIIHHNQSLVAWPMLALEDRDYFIFELDVYGDNHYSERSNDYNLGIPALRRARLSSNLHNSCHTPLIALRLGATQPSSI